MISNMIALDWRAMKYYQIRGLLLPVFGLFIGIIYSPIFVIPFFAFIGISFSINPFAVEEKGELNNLYLTLPIKRSQIILGRYLLSFLILFAGILLGLPIMILSNIFAFSKYYIGAEGIFALISMSLLMYSILNLFMFPTLFKLGYQKGKTWGFYIPVILFTILFFGYYMLTQIPGKETLTIDLIVYATEHLFLVCSGFIIAAFALLFISYMISVKVYSKRNF